MQVLRNQVVPGYNNLPILWDLFLPETPGNTVLLYTHGFNGFKDWGGMNLIAEWFCGRGIAFFKYNASHNGTSPEHPEEFVNLHAFSQDNFSIGLYDLSMCMNLLTQNANHFQGFKHIVLLGHSKGGGLSILQTAKDARVSALITWASVHECKTPWGRWNDEQMQRWKQNGVAYYFNARTAQQMPLNYQLAQDFFDHEEAFDLQSNISRIQQPMLLIHGTQDQAVPITAGRLLRSWNPAAAWMEPETDHVFGRKHPESNTALPELCVEVMETMIDFLNRQELM
ncbi:MAG: alpha/beta hydrolase [Chitinophagaceae bacterium]|nr:alpha/beta hydrolase [Chitinophagaceae bacterium]